MEMSDIPWFVWFGLAWLALIVLAVWLNHRFWKRFGEQMEPWEDDEHRGGV